MHVSHATFSSGESFLRRNQLPKILITHLEHSILHLAVEVVHRARCGPRNLRTVYRKNCCVAWTDKLLLRLGPWNRAAKMRANLRYHMHWAILAVHYVER